MVKTAGSYVNNWDTDAFVREAGLPISATVRLSSFKKSHFKRKKMMCNIYNIVYRVQVLP